MTTEDVSPASPSHGFTGSCPPTCQVTFDSDMSPGQETYQGRELGNRDKTQAELDRGRIRKEEGLVKDAARIHGKAMKEMEALKAAWGNQTSSSSKSK